MSRHRDVRSMNYSDEYDGYDDVYGHSVEDDYCVSPSAEQFMFDRNKRQNIASYFTEEDIVEGNEDMDNTTTLVPPGTSFTHKSTELSNLDAAKLSSCIEAIRNVIGDTVSESTLIEKILQSNFNTEAALDAILKESSPKDTTDRVANSEQPDAYQGMGSLIGRSHGLVHALTSSSVESNTASAVNAEFPRNKVFSADYLDKRSFQKSSEISMNLKNNALMNKQFPSVFPSDILNKHTDFRPKTMDALPASPPSLPVKNTQSFASLADLASHHLQNTSSSVIAQSPITVSKTNSSFVIPKFRKKFGPLSADVSNSAKTHETLVMPMGDQTIPESHVPALCNDENTIERLGKSFSEAGIMSADSVVEDKSSTVEEGLRTPSPDNWVIDLSNALRESVPAAARLPSRDTSRTEWMFPISDGCSLDFSIDADDVIPLHGALTNLEHECNLDLRNLQHAELSYSKKVASLFGKTLCKRWNSRKSYIRNPRKQLKTVVPFDFHSPSPDSVILANLCRRDEKRDALTCQ